MSTNAAAPVSKIKILFLGANPSDTTRLALDREVREITQRLRATPLAAHFEIVQEWAVRVVDLQAAFLRHRPQVVHFSGHGQRRRAKGGATSEDLNAKFAHSASWSAGEGSSEILVEDEAGKLVSISAPALADLFRIVGEVRCVVLNACHSAAQADTIRQHVDCVVGMDRAIQDQAAIAFAWAFYQGLGFGESVTKAFELGKNQIHLEGLAEVEVPRLMLRGTFGADDRSAAQHDADAGGPLVSFSRHMAPPCAPGTLLVGSSINAHLELLLDYVVEQLQTSVFDIFNTSEVLMPDFENIPGSKRTPRHPEAYRSRLPCWLNSVEARPRSFSSLRDAFKHYRGVLLLLGDPGSGKSTSLLGIARELIHERLQDETALLPVFAPIDTWRSEPIVPWLARVTELAEATLNAAMKHQRLVLLLDGLDELPTNEHCHDFLTRLNQFDEISVLLTCRRQIFEEVRKLAGGLSSWRGGLVAIAGFTDNQIESYLQSHPDLLKSVRADAELSQLVRQPLLLTILATTYQGMEGAALQLGDLRRYPGALRQEIFHQFVIRRYEYECLKSGRAPLLPVDEVYEVLGHVAVNMILISRGCNEFKPEVVQRAYSGNVVLLLNVAENLHMICRDNANNYRFLHLLLRDHVAVARCLRQMISDDAQERALAVQAICQLEEDAAMEALLVLITDPNLFVVRSTLRALARIGDASVLRRLIEVTPRLMRFGDRMLEYELVQALVIVGRPHISILLDGMHHQEKMVRDIAGQALTELNDLLRTGQLLPLLESDNKDIRWWGAKLLARIGPSVTHDLSPLLHSPSISLRVAVIETFGLMKGDASVVSILALCLKDEAIEIRAAAANSLGIWAGSRNAGQLHSIKGKEPAAERWEPSVEVSESLIRLRFDQDESVRRSSAFAMGRCGIGKAVEPLLSLLCDDSFDVRAAAIDSLGMLGDRRAIPHLERVLSNTTAPATLLTLSKALEALGYTSPYTRAILDEAETVTQPS
jgi:HEAT repeat protein/DNA polymerase III delta prime subunit